jgi:FkbM family methyltransferase
MPPTLSQRIDDAVLYMTLAHVVSARLASRPDPGFFFVQVGGFDGRDQIHELVDRFDLAGLVVEPQSRYFDRLKDAYATHDRVSVVRAAVDVTEGEGLLWTVREGMPDWTHQLASFHRENLLKHDSPDCPLEANLVAEDVPIVSFETLLADVERVDLLQIDTEGHDATLIAAFDFERWRPGVVQFEHRHLSTAEHDRAIRRLVDRGYRVALSRFDTIAALD